MGRHASLAEYYRHHRRAFTLALELDCTPKEAEAELERREARERWDETERRLQAKMAAPARVCRAGHDQDERASWWWEREALR